MKTTLQIVGDSKFGGATYLIITWCKYLIENGWHVSVLTTNAETIAALSKISGLIIIDSVYIPRDIKPVEDIKAFFRLVKLLQHSRFDVVHTYTATPGFIGRIAARITRVPVIVHHQAGWTVTDFSSLATRIIYTPLEYIATLASTKGICVSHAVRKEAEDKHIAPAAKLVTICNGIEAEPFLSSENNIAGNSLRKKLGIPFDHIVIGSTGRLAAQKDYSTFFFACRKILDLLPQKEISIVVAGNGPQKEELEQLVCSLNLQDRVYFLGFVQNIPSVLAMLDVFIISSLWEGLSISLLEAMASAKPIVATSIGPNAELIDHELTGLLVEPRSPEKLAGAVVKFIREPELAQKCAAAARKSVLNDYTLDRMFRETMALYSNLLTVKTNR